MDRDRGLRRRVAYEHSAPVLPRGSHHPDLQDRYYVVPASPVQPACMTAERLHATSNMMLMMGAQAAGAAHASAGEAAPALTDVAGTLAYVWRTLRGAGVELRRLALALGGVALFLAARLMALQAASLLVVPLFWTLPRILELQATLPAAVVEGVHERNPCPVPGSTPRSGHTCAINQSILFPSSPPGEDPLIHTWRLAAPELY